MSQKAESIVVVGFGWVGQANALGLALLGHTVSYFDIGEPELHYVEKYKEVYDTIPRCTSLLEKDSENTWYIVCVGDRVDDRGFQDISSVEKALHSLTNTQGGIILRSTILPESLKHLDFDYYVPEFLHEKFAVEESVKPHYFVIGARRDINEIPYFLREWEEYSSKVFRGTPEEASFVKYLSNIWNAFRIAFVNEFGDIVGEPKTKRDVAKIEKVLDFILERKMYLKYGKAFDGHCLPKDMRAFASAYRDTHTTALLDATYITNTLHKEREHMYVHLPEWFSSWDENGGPTIGVIGRMWRYINQQSMVRRARRRLRFIKDWSETFFGRPSLKKQQAVWNSFGKKHHYYYMNTRTRSGRGVTEEEFRETGRRDVEDHIENDVLLKEHVVDLRNAVFLEIGSGSGRMTEFLSDVCQTVYAIDISDILVEIGRSRLIEKKNVYYMHTEGDVIPRGDASVDIVFSYLSLHNIPDEDVMVRYFAEIARVMKKDGIAKIHLRTGRAPRKWMKTYGITLSPREARRLSEWAGLTPLKHEVSENGNHMWVWLKK